MSDDHRRDQDGPSTEAWSGSGSGGEIGSTVVATDAGGGQGATLGADRALLVGLLALQNGFIDASTLVDAVHAWIADKGRPMGAILLGWEQVDGEQLAVLEQLASVALKRDGGDVGRCLSGFGSTPSLIHLLGSLEDDEVRTLLAGADNLARARARGRGDDRSGSRYRIIRHHAQGGLGEVFLAEDTEVGRDVALKEIQARYSDHDQYRARFLLEAEVTAGLEHPGIVPIHGMGRYADGRPYYAMRFIKGDSLKQAIADFRANPFLAANPRERALALRGLLRRFLDVCDAIEYAHSRRVLHRDIKPANIMLGKFGETLVVDWGVAKLLDKPDTDGDFEGIEPPLHPSSYSDVEPTRMESACGSPPYMSPEQAAGRVDLVDVPSDVYGLGATLYSLLTGVAPFPERPLPQIKPAILAGEFPRPREVDASVPPALEAICLKAMALGPADRYPSSRALAVDLERWLDDEPVSAHAEPLAARAARWARRHRPLVAGVAATLVVAVVALGINGHLVRIERDKAIAADNAKTHTLGLMEATLGETGRAITMLMTDIAADRFASSPELQTIRGYLAEKTARIARSFVQQRPGDIYIQNVAAPILYRAGVIQRVVGQPNKSMEDLRLAEFLFSELDKNDPKRRLDYLDARAAIAIEMGETCRQAGRNTQAIQCYGTAQSLAGMMRDDYPGDTRHEQPLARSYYNLAALLINRGDFARARRPSEQAITLLERSIARARAEKLVQFLKSLAGLIMTKGDRGKSSRPAEPKLATLRRLISGLSKADLNQLLLTYPRLSLAISLRETGHFDEADRAFELAMKNVDVYESNDSRSNVTDYFRASILVHRALLLAKTEAHWPEAERLIGESLTILDRLVADFRGFTPYLLYSADHLTERAKLRFKRGGEHLEGARADARRALAILDQFGRDHPTYGGIKGGRAVSLGLLGRIEPDRTQAERLLTEAIFLDDASLVDDPDDQILRAAREDHRNALARLRATP